MQEPSTTPLAHLVSKIMAAPKTALAARRSAGVVDRDSATGVAGSTINVVIEDATTLSAMTRWRRAFGALAQVMADPEKTDQVLVFSIYANAGSMPERIHRFLNSPEGRRLYQEHRTIDSRTVDLDALAALPAG